MLLISPFVAAAPTADAVDKLPAYGVPPSPQFSGYLNASAAEPGTHLHYWFAAKTSDDWAKAPVILWLNGGPGSSSILGMLQEQGPLVIDHDGNLLDNPYAWTNIANLFVIESPAGVGYSYCAAMEKGGDCANTDISTAKAAHAALQDFFTNKFPELRANPFIITGESYAGVYSPTLADQVVKGNDAGQPRINLVGMAVGDPCTDNKAQKQAFDMLWYAHKYGLVPDDEYDLLVNECGYSHPNPRTAGEWVTAPKGHKARVVPATPLRPPLREGASDKCTSAHRKFLLSSSKGISQSWEKAYINELSYYSAAGPFRFDLPGTFNYRTAEWMMRDDVKKALHVESAPVKAWPGPTPGWKYTSSYDACNDAAKPGTKSMIDFYRELAPALSGKIVVYNGDTDPCVTYEGTRTAIGQVGFGVVEPYRPWFFNFTAGSEETLKKKDILFGPSLSYASAGAQFGGNIVDYEHGLSFATVHGSGHMVPTFRPRAALQLIAHVVGNTSFAPHIPADADLAAMSESDFDKFLDSWTDRAEAAPFVG